MSNVMDNEKYFVCPECDLEYTAKEWDESTVEYYNCELEDIISCSSVRISYGDYCCPSCDAIIDGGELERYQEHVAEVSRHRQEEAVEEVRQNEIVRVGRYILFAYNNYYPEGGSNDMCCIFDDPDDIELERAQLDCDVYQIFDLYTTKAQNLELGMRWGQDDADRLLRIKMFAEEFISKE